MFYRKVLDLLKATNELSHAKQSYSYAHSFNSYKDLENIWWLKWVLHYLSQNVSNDYPQQYWSVVKKTKQKKQLWALKKSTNKL